MFHKYLVIMFLMRATTIIFLCVLLFIFKTVENLKVESAKICSKRNGYFEIDHCSNEYVACFNGVEKRMICKKDSHVFSEIHQECVRPSHIPGCGKNKIGYKYHPSCSEFKFTSSVVPLQTASKCDKVVAYCHGSTLVIEKCPSGKYFDYSSGKCLSMTTNPECMVLNTIDTKDALFTYCQQGKPVVPTGDCTDQLVICTGRKPFVVQCLSGQIYDQVTRMCQKREKVYQCLEKDGRIQVETEKATSNIHKEFHDSPQAAKNHYYLPTPFENFDFCQQKPDGYYYNNPFACVAEIYLCAEGQTKILKCKVDMFFDTAFQTCHQKPECHSGVLHESTDNKLTKLAEKICSKKATDGVFGMGECKPYFALCDSNVASAFHCPAGQAFDPHFVDCVQYDRVETCNAKSDLEETIDRLESTDPSVACQKNPNGISGLSGRSDVFVICTNGIPYVEECPEAGVIYDYESGHPISHPFCNERGLYNGKSTISDDEKWQLGKQIEKIPKKCSKNGELRSHPKSRRQFLQCANGVYVELKCPPTTIFVPSISVCDHENKYDVN